MILDKIGQFKYNQRNNAVDGENTCGPTNCVQAYAVTNYTETFPKGRYVQPEDNFTEFMRSYWSSVLGKVYGINVTDEVPANEYLKLLTIGFNLWMSKLQGDFFYPVCVSREFNMDELEQFILKGEAVVCSISAGAVKGHFITVVGVDDDNFYVYDTYGDNISILKNFEKVGKANKVPKALLWTMMKVHKAEKKYGIVFLKGGCNE